MTTKTSSWSGFCAALTGAFTLIFILTSFPAITLAAPLDSPSAAKANAGKKTSQLTPSTTQTTISQTSTPSPSPTPSPSSQPAGTTTKSLTTTNQTQSASLSSQLSTPSAEVVEKIKQKKEQDITETSGQQKNLLTTFLEQNPVGALSWNNFLQHSLRRAIAKGLPANIIVLILLFPVITSIISASRHVIGLKGFGIYTPAVLAVAFSSTGIIPGIIMFGVVLAAALTFRSVVKKLELQYLPRTAMLLWGVSLATLTFLMLTTFAGVELFVTLSIFPLLIIMLLTENFLETQLASTQYQAIQLTLETLFIAIICSMIISSELIQQWVILNPELTVIVVAAFNIIVGRYTGLRLMEYIRFRPILSE